MEFKDFAGVKLPLLGFGTWGIGGWHDASTLRDDQGISAIKAAVDAGMTHIDTAELYGAGHAEELIAKAINGADRKKLFITSKVRPENCSYNGVLASCRASLKRLNLDYLDLYLIHKPSSFPIKETMRAMNELVDNGLTRFIGVSNFTVEDLKEAQKYTKHKLFCNQVHYSLVARNHSKFTMNTESKIIPYCQKHGIAIVAFRPVQKGLLSKAKEFPILGSLAAKYEKTAAQIALNWLYCKDVFALVKTVNHLEENLGSLGWRLDAEDVAALDEAFKNY